MNSLSIIVKARHLTNQLRNVPLELIKTEFDSLLGVLHSDEKIVLILTNLVKHEQAHIGANAGAFIQGTPAKHQIGLEFANSPEKRAAFGYQVLSGLLLDTNMSNDKLRKIILNDGGHYALGTTQISDIIAEFIKVFIEPIISYLEHYQSDEDLILILMNKYKQRCEWFDTERLLQISLVNGNSKSPNGHVEQRLKRDFCRYLFDNGLDFVMEAESPKQKGMTDVLTPKLTNGQRLVVEAKVFDGINRDESWIREGIAQAASYAEDWGEGLGYLLIYNVAHNCLLEFEGSSRLSNLWVNMSHGKEIRLVDINLNNDLPSSKANQLITHKI